ncbi:MAG: hypothetical protein COY81_02635 [Candidatus Pacebacteria bacterium CG_4_10_14_0_8_um_filter_43_12]|nr:MAG: hypothetical protein COU66_00885 [Candidatus Pacebacteria bacterium CG10_big_fil_rev_8_21_14_0_10_44_11]PIY79438.1 MAG: hypothetical protein COY81_02635 [Candidatus Pacebacteria bacterium CG_4_10_14_0_8_um_filter_43_12]
MTIVTVLLSTALIAALLTPVVIKVYRHFNWLDDPEKERHLKKVHQVPVPRGGGVVVFIAILIASFFFLKYDQYLFSIMLGAGLLAVVGTLDDIFDLHPLTRLVVGFVAALIVVGSGIGISYVSNPLMTGQVIHLDQPQLQFQFWGTQRSVWILADLLAVLFIVWNMNIVNWSKGVDGQMPGFVVVALVFIGILSERFIDDPSQFNTTLLSFIAAGAFLGLLIWNWYPQKIMPGYGAGTLAGYFLSVLAILSGAKVATTLMVLAIPTADAIFTVTRRVLAGKSPFWGDRGHLHHKLLDVFKWNKQQIAIFYWSTSLVLGVLSLYLNTLGKVITIGVTMMIIFGVLIWAKIRSDKVN